MKIIFSVTGWVLCVIISAIGFAVLRYETSWRDEEISKLKQDNTRMKRGISKMEVGLSNVKNISDEMPSKLLDLQRNIEESQALSKFDDLARKAMDLQRAQEDLKKAEEAEMILSRARVDSHGSEPKEMTNEEKLASYISYGIDGIPQKISKPIIDAASQEKHAFSAVYEIEKQAKGYLDFENFKKAPTRMPINVKNAMVNRAMRENPGNWARMADEITDQVGGWNVIQGWTSTGVPGLSKVESISAIREAAVAYPDNWEMQVSRVKTIADR